MFGKIKTLIWNRKYLILFIGLFLIVFTQRFLNEKQPGLVKSIASDGTGYYCYLPAALIYQDFSYEFFNKPENSINSIYRPDITKYKDRGVNKYYCGTAMCLLPFFLIGILISVIAGTDVNGYTDTFLMLVSLASIIYYLLSVFLISKIAKFFNISEKISLAGCFIFFFGTNLFHYTIQEPSMSHIYSFFAVSLFFYLFTRLINNSCQKNFIYLGLAIGLVFLIRPVNIIIILFTPFFFKNIVTYFEFLKSIFVSNLKGFFYFILAATSIVFIQFLLYYFQTGDFFIVAYEGETFDFLKPEFFNTLFSYKKGLLLYVPLVFLALAFILITQSNWYKKTIFLITFFVFLYITASWWCWWYGGGLSIRPIVDILPIFILTSVLLFNKLSVFRKKIILFLTIPFLFYNQIIAFQYANLLIDYDKMDKDKFWDVFLETEANTVFENKKTRILIGRTILKTECLNYENFESDNVIVNEGFNSKKACLVGKSNYYSKGLTISEKDINFKGSFYIIVECMAKAQEGDKGLSLVLAATQNDILAGWYMVFCKQFSERSDGWTRMCNIIEIDGSFMNEKSIIKIFANSENGKYLVDDLKYSIIIK